MGEATHARIVWAIDPFAENSALQRAAAKTLKKFLAARADKQFVVEPVYVFSSYPVEFRFVAPEVFQGDLRKAGQKELEKLLKSVPIPNVRPLTVITKPYLSNRLGIDELVRFSKEHSAEFVFVSTHARKGLKRLVLGSFAEGMIHYSDLPLFVVNPTQKEPKNFKSILFPTDFSKASHDAYLEALKLAKSLGAQLTLFHKYKYILTPTLETAFSAYPQYKDVFTRELGEKKKEAAKWMEEGQRAGVKVKLVLDYKLMGSASDSIIAQSKKHNLTLMASRSGPIASAILGSTARQVIRGAKTPVLIFHPL